MVHRILYKYFPLSNDKHFERLEALLGGKLFFSYPSSFNDPFELRPVIQKPTQKQVLAFLSKYEDMLNKSQRIRLAERLDGHVAGESGFSPEWVDSFGVLCLTPYDNNLLMWSHYASSHSGVCVGFDTSLSPFSSAKPIEYMKQRPRLKAGDLENVSEDELLGKVFYSKSDHWGYESEWRCLKRTLRDSDKKALLRAVDDGFLTTDEAVDQLSLNGGPGVYPFDPLAIRRVVLGANACKDTVDRVSCMLDSMSKRPKAFQYEIDHAYYGLKKGCRI